MQELVMKLQLCQVAVMFLSLKRIKMYNWMMQLALVSLMACNSAAVQSDSDTRVSLSFERVLWGKWQPTQQESRENDLSIAQFPPAPLSRFNHWTQGKAKSPSHVERSVKDTFIKSAINYICIYTSATGGHWSRLNWFQSLVLCKLIAVESLYYVLSSQQSCLCCCTKESTCNNCSVKTAIFTGFMKVNERLFKDQVKKISGINWIEHSAVTKQFLVSLTSMGIFVHTIEVNGDQHSSKYLILCSTEE